MNFSAASGATGPNTICNIPLKMNGISMNAGGEIRPIVIALESLSRNSSLHKEPAEVTSL